MGLQRYLDDFLRKIPPQYYPPNVNAKGMLEGLQDTLRPFWFNIGDEDYPTFLATGRAGESSVYEFGPDQILRMGPKFEPFLNFAGEKTRELSRRAIPNVDRLFPSGNRPGPVELFPLEGRLEPLTEFSLGRGRAVGLYPKVETVQHSKTPGIKDQLKKMGNQFEEAWYNKEAKEGFDAASSPYQIPNAPLGNNLFSKSYQGIDLHKDNLGWSPETGYVAVDLSSGLVPQSIQEGYPRQGYLPQHNLLGSYFEEADKPEVTREMLQQILKSRLEGLEPSPYPRSLEF